MIPDRWWAPARPRRYSRQVVNLEDLEHTLRDRLDAIGPVPRAELLRVLRLPDRDRAERIGELHADTRSTTFAELLIDIEESTNLRGVVTGMLREEEMRGG